MNNDLLLTDAEVKKVLDAFGNQPDERTAKDVWDMLDQAQLAKSEPLIRVDTYREIGEWGNSYCIEHRGVGGNQWYASVKKRECKDCWETLKAGKSPTGESGK